MLTACAGTLKNQSYEDHELSDPFQPLNRATYSFNNAIDKAMLKPMAKAYETVIPYPARKGVSNFYSNATEPLNFINNLLQLKLDDSLTSFTRFAFNSTLGLGGLIDITGEMGLMQKEEDFGQTLAFWGVKPGPFIMLPLLGPSNLRDLTGTIPDTLLSVSNIHDSSSTNAGLTLLDIVATRASFLSLDSLLDKQVDPYTFLKSGYEQNRIGLIFDGNPPEPYEDF